MNVLNKITLHKLSIILALLIAIHYYRLDPKCFLGYLFFSLVFLVIPFLWNRWLYNELTRDAKSPISYKMFINIGIFVYLGLIIFALFLVLSSYKPPHYVEGVC